MGAAPLELMSTIDDRIHPMLRTAAANRELDVWIDPDVLEVDRFTPPHLPVVVAWAT